MRVRIRTEEFPPKDVWLKAFSTSVYYETIVNIFDVMYTCLKTNANTIGFDLVRYNFEECQIILYNQQPFGWLIDIKIY